MLQIRAAIRSSIQMMTTTSQHMTYPRVVLLDMAINMLYNPFPQSYADLQPRSIGLSPE